MCGCFVKQLKNNLKQGIKGELRCHIISDTLIVDIYARNNIVFRYTCDCITHQIVQGLTSEMCYKTIEKRYRRYINNLYFNENSY